MIDPRDPLAGLDPYPRELVDALGSDQERADLLEEIVSTPGPVRSTPARTRALLAIGIAAAVAIIGGGWLLASTNGDGDDTPVAAASATTTSTSTPTAASTAPITRTGGVNRDHCRRLLSRNGQLRGLLKLQGVARNGSGQVTRRSRDYLVATRSGRRYVVEFGPGCKIRYLRDIRHH